MYCTYTDLVTICATLKVARFLKCYSKGRHFPSHIGLTVVCQYVCQFVVVGTRCGISSGTRACLPTRSGGSTSASSSWSTSRSPWRKTDRWPTPIHRMRLAKPTSTSPPAQSARRPQARALLLHYGRRYHIGCER